MRDQKHYYVYILGSLSGTLYIGITNNLVRRVWEHKQGFVEGFTSKYGVDRLLWWESYETVLKAIAREKQLKRWRREKKVWLIEQRNPEWKDLSRGWYGEPIAPPQLKVRVVEKE
jgi:putative endonuclease